MLHKAEFINIKRCAQQRKIYKYKSVLHKAEFINIKSVLRKAEFINIKVSSVIWNL